MKPAREKLENDLLRLAIDDTSVTCGKWMLFPLEEDVPHYWRLVMEATSQRPAGTYVEDRHTARDARD